MAVTYEVSSFVKLINGEKVDKITLKNKESYEVSFITLGATMYSLKTPDRNGIVEEISLQKKALEDIYIGNVYYGATIGRYAGRIGYGKFSIDGKEYSLSCNGGKHHAHGGNIGFDKRVWKYEIKKGKTFVTIIFTLTSPDGEEGYPGTLEAKASYTLNDKNQLIAEFEANTDKPTIVNMTNHCYFNLSGDYKRKIYDHTIRLNCSNYTPFVDGLPTGEITPVKGSLLDFTKAKTLNNLNDIHEGGKNGIDNCFVIDHDDPIELNETETTTPTKSSTPSKKGKRKEPSSGKIEKTSKKIKMDPIVLCAEVSELNGRRMKIYTNQCGLVVYTGNWLNDEYPYVPHNSICFEPTYYTNSPNVPTFPSPILRPSETYFHKTIYEFSVDN